MRIVLILGFIILSLSSSVSYRFPDILSPDETGEEEKEIDRTELMLQDKMKILEKERTDVMVQELKNQYLLDKLGELQKEKNKIELNLAQTRTNNNLQHRTNQLKSENLKYFPKISGPVELGTVRAPEKARSFTTRRTASFSHSIMSTFSNIGNIEPE